MLLTQLLSKHSKVRIFIPYCHRIRKIDFEEHGNKLEEDIDKKNCNSIDVILTIPRNFFQKYKNERKTSHGNVNICKLE